MLHSTLEVAWDHSITASSKSTGKQDSMLLIIISSKIMLESLLLMGLACCACIVAPSLYLIAVGFFFVNFFQRGFFNASLILFFEISSENL